MDKNKTQTKQFTLTPYNNERLAKLCGTLNEHLSTIESHYHVQITQRGNCFQITGNPKAVLDAQNCLNELYDQTQYCQTLTKANVHHLFNQPKERVAANTKHIHVRTKRLTIYPRGNNQKHYLRMMLEKPINFAIGPAGTGKTFLAVAAAVEALETHRAQRIILVRPAVEAGEKLGFLPGDLEEKVSPYLRPLYDALYEMLGFAEVHKMIEHHVIEIAPLAYMRGRTLNDAFIILDEAQNTTVEQMQMFLTRLGFDSTMVITGDVTQVDLAKGIVSGLKHAQHVLANIDAITFNWFEASDTIRHPVVKSIIQAYQQVQS